MSPLKPDTERFVAAHRAATGLPVDIDTDPQSAEQFITALRSVPQDRPAVHDAEVSISQTTAGTVPIRIYRPHGDRPGSRSVTLYLHGGGWVGGCLDLYDQTCVRLAKYSGHTVVSVDYRLAPEHPFPAAIDDAWAATLWVHDHAHEFGWDREALTVAGSSAGGNLAIGVGVLARDVGPVQIRGQVLLYPVCDARMDSESYRQFGSGHLLDTDVMRWFWRQYLHNADDVTNPLASPAALESVAGLPPTALITAECDPLRDEAEAFARRLARAGVQVTVNRFRGQVHGFALELGNVADAELALRRCGTHLNAMSYGQRLNC